MEITFILQFLSISSAEDCSGFPQCFQQNEGIVSSNMHDRLLQEAHVTVHVYSLLFQTKMPELCV
jgi:hypothetical protein